MASIFMKRGTWWARLKGYKHPDKWSDHDTGETDREKALEFMRDGQKALDKRNGIRSKDALTLTAWVKMWLKRREESGHDWKHDRGILGKHVLPAIGGEDLADIDPPAIVSLFHALRFRSEPALAPRTVHNIYSVVAAVFRDARLAGVLKRDNPCILTDEQLGPIVDKNPEWRSGAVYTREEVETLISDSRIPFDRRLVYALTLLAGLRPGEAGALRWKHYNREATPLGSLLIAKSYKAKSGEVKGTKTNTVKHVPVHPVLAAMLAEWHLSGWAAMFGAQPSPEDLIVPLPPEVKRTKRTGERFRPYYYTGKRWREDDLPALGWRRRSVYDGRATFITLALEDGADEDIIRDRVTHTKSKRNAFSGYDRGERWAETCREVAKLRVSRPADSLQTGGEVSESTKESGSGGGFRTSDSARPGLIVIQGGREVIYAPCDSMLQVLEASVLTAETVGAVDEKTA